MITTYGGDPITLQDLVERFTTDDKTVLLGCHENSNRRVQTYISSTRSSDAHEMFYISTEDGRSLKITSNQKIWNVKEEKWVLSQYVAPGMIVLLDDRKSTKVVESHSIHEIGLTKMYTLSIGKTQNYYANGILVHNMSDEDWSRLLPKNATYYWQMEPPKKARIVRDKSSGNDSSTFGGAGGGLASLVGEMGGWGPAPRLAPINRGSGIEIEGTESPSVYVNVRDTHHWTESPVSSRREVPALQLKELEILVNPMVNQILQNVGVLASNLDGAIDSVKNATNSLKELMKAQSAVQATDDENAKQKNASSVKAGTKRVMKQVATAGEDFVHNKHVSYYSDPLSPYNALYITKPTGFKYALPYMQDKYIETTNSFGGESGEGVNTGILETVSEGARLIGDFLGDIQGNKIFAAGRMIEQPEGFTFSGREKSYTVSFPLFNTKDYAEIIKNWQFLFLLNYQNTPNRLTRDLIDPPCIYEAYLPGVWYSPYCCVTNLTVDYVGGRREMELPVPYVGEADSPAADADAAETWIKQKKKIRTIVPDAYNVTVTLTELFAGSQNFMYHMLTESMDDKITVSTKRGGAN